MANDVCFIQRTTLEEIADAIRTAKDIGVKIPVSVLKEALLTGEVTTTAPTATATWYRIRRQTLVDIADGVRQIDETTGAIVGAELAARILELNITQEKQLATPVIYLYDDEWEGNTTAILGRAILGLAILGNSGNIEKLDTPVIYLVDEDAIPVIKLATPVIELVDEDAIPVQKLATPVIYLYDDTEEEPEVTVIQLATPVIELVEVEEGGEDEPVEPTTIQLATPIIYLEEIGEEEPEEPIEPTVEQLETPVIYLEVIEDETEEPDVPVEPTVIQLDTPIIWLEEIEDEGEVEPEEPVEIVTIGYDSYGYIPNGELVASNTVKYSVLIPLENLVNGSDGWCVYIEEAIDNNDAENKGAFYDADGNIVGNYQYEEKEGTAEEIKQDAPSTATQVRFFLNTEASLAEGQDLIYVTPFDGMTSNKLATPVIYLEVA